MNQAYGVFQSAYMTPSHASASLLPPSERADKALVAFIGTLGAGLTWGGSIFVNPLMSRGLSLRRISLTGAALMCAGFALASFCGRAWQLLLTQGLLYGVGSSCLYFPVLSTAPEYFGAHRGAAMGAILSAAGVGALTYAPLAQALLERVGARWTLRALALANLVVGVAVAQAVPRRGRCATKRPTLVNMRIARRPAFILQAGAAMLQAAGNFVPLTFLPEFSVALGYSASVGALLLAISSGVNSASRLGMGVLADAVGRQNTLVLSVLTSAICVAGLWMSAVGGAKGVWIAFVVLYGLSSGGKSLLQHFDFASSDQISQDTMHSSRPPSQRSSASKLTPQLMDSHILSAASGRCSGRQSEARSSVKALKASSSSAT